MPTTRSAALALLNSAASEKSSDSDKEIVMACLNMERQQSAMTEREREEIHKRALIEPPEGFRRWIEVRNKLRMKKKLDSKLAKRGLERTENPSEEAVEDELKEECSPVQTFCVDSSRGFSTVQVGMSSSSTKDNVHFAAQPMSYDEKARLRDDILELLERDEHEKISGIANLLKLREPNLEAEDGFDIDFEVLKTSTIRALEGYVAVALRKKIPKLSILKSNDA